MRGRAVAFLVLGAALVTIWQVWPSDERRIKRLIREMAAAVGPDQGEGDLARAGRLAPLARALASDVVIEGLPESVPGGGGGRVRGRENLIGAVMQIGRAIPELAVHVRNVEVTFAPDYSSAQALAAVEVRGVGRETGGAWSGIDEIELDLVRLDDTWLVSRIAPHAVLRR